MLLKQIHLLSEGGKATAKYGTERATGADIAAALKVVSEVTGLSEKVLASRLLGSGRLTLAGKQKDSGDVDIALLDKDRDQIVAAMKKVTGAEPYVIGGDTFSFPVASGSKKVQVDLMFVPDIKWAKFSHYASEHSAHKSGVRNELLHSALKFSMEDGKDVRLSDEDGDIARASRSYKLMTGVERIFKVSKMRKDGAGRLKGSVKATPEEVRKALDAAGNDAVFSSSPDVIRDPDVFAKMLFGEKASQKDLMSAERLIFMISKRKDAAAIFKDAARGIKNRGFALPKELKKYD